MALASLGSYLLAIPLPAGSRTPSLKLSSSEGTLCYGKIRRSLKSLYTRARTSSTRLVARFVADFVGQLFSRLTQRADFFIAVGIDPAIPLVQRIAAD
jgi:hypothetical protein